MLNKKICMLGSMSVGKTSLIRSFVSSIFSDEYLSTVGVKVSKKTVTVSEREMTLMLWDLEGQDDFGDVNVSYLKGASGLLFVIDGTRGHTLTQVLDLRGAAFEVVGEETPHLFLVNKSDLREQWQITDAILETLQEKGYEVLEVSAKTGQNVEEAFRFLADMMLETA